MWCRGRRRRGLIEWLSAAATVPLLIYATISDVRSSYVSDYVWVVGLVAAALINVAGLWLRWISVIDLIGVGVLIGAVLILDRFTHLGGADKLAIVTVAALNPSLLFSVYYLVTLASSTLLISLFMKRRFPYLPVLSACYFIKLLL